MSTSQKSVLPFGGYKNKSCVLLTYNRIYGMILVQGSNQSYASLYCTGTGGFIGYNNCNAYGSYCNTWGGRHQYSYVCDN